MSSENLSIAEHYYSAMNRKDLKQIEQLLHPNVIFVGPLAQLEGLEPVLQAIQGFTAAFESLEIRARFDNEQQVMLAIDTQFDLSKRSCAR